MEALSHGLRGAEEVTVRRRWRQWSRLRMVRPGRGVGGETVTSTPDRWPPTVGEAGPRSQEGELPRDRGAGLAETRRSETPADVSGAGRAQRASMAEVWAGDEGWGGTSTDTESQEVGQGW